MKKVMDWIKKNKTTTILGLIIVVLVFSMFGSGSSYSSNSYTTDMSKGYTGLPSAGLAESSVQSSSQSTQTLNREIITTGSVDMKVGSVDSAMTQIENIVQKYNGYVSYSSSDKNLGYKTGYITIRVSQKDFATAMSEIASIGKVESKNTNSNDVTEQYIDIDARLKNLKATEQRYLELLNETKTIEDILKIEEQLTSIRSDIDSLQGQKDYLDGQIQMSTITVNVHEQQPYVPEIDWSSTFSEATNGFFSMIQGIIIFTLTLLPLAIVGYVIWFVYRRVRK